MREQPTRLQAVLGHVGSTARLAVVAAFSGVVESFATASIGTRSLKLVVPEKAT